MLRLGGEPPSSASAASSSMQSAEGGLLTALTDQGCDSPLIPPAPCTVPPTPRSAASPACVAARTEVASVALAGVPTSG